MTTTMLVAAIQEALRKTPDLPVRVNRSNIVKLDPQGAHAGGPHMELESGQRIDFDDQPLGSTFTDLQGKVHVIAFGRWGIDSLSVPTVDHPLLLLNNGCAISGTEPSSCKFRPSPAFEGFAMLQVRPNCACGDRDLPPIADAATARAVMQKLSEHLRAAGMDRFRAPPPEPTTCCGRGCDGCVWASYFAAMGRWRDDALALLSPNVADPAPERRR